MNFASSALWALLRLQGLGSTGFVASLDPNPRGGGGAPPLYGPQNGSTEQWVLSALEVICSTKLNKTYGGV